MSAGGTGQAAGQGGDMPARDPAGTAALERRYLRLLRCYPPSHRAFHREEMLGVLLATARPGQRTPGLGQTVNLAACGLAIRVRRIPGWLAAEAGQDALAVVSLIAPAVVFILLALGWAVNAAAGARVLPRVPVWTPLLPVPVLPFSGESVVVMIAWLAVVVLGLTGRQRTAAKIAFISLTLALLALLLVLVVLIQQVHSFYFNTFPGELFQFLPFGDVPVVLASLAACSLALSPGPRRGLAIVGWRRACLMIAGLSAGFGFPAIVQLVNPAAPIWDLAFRLLGVLAIAVAVAVTCVRGPVGRRVAGLVAAGLLPGLAVAIPLRDVPAVFPVPILVSLLAAVLVWPVAIVSWRGRAERRRRLAERGPDFTVVYAEVYAEFQAFCARRRLPASSTRQLERAWDAWQAGRFRRGEISQWPFYGDNPFRPR
ncbi:MAG TPA: hypothetical protein VJ351_05950 [Streptosporangiaceae bacterium]|nr:hypothetical protein [Streptosporangiaceae bacterium]